MTNNALKTKSSEVGKNGSKKRKIGSKDVLERLQKRYSGYIFIVFNIKFTLFIG